MGSNDTFQFCSGGRHHYGGFGEWIFTLERGGRLHAEQFVGDKKKHDKAYTLAKDENEKCWACIDALALPALKGSDRAGVPDEAQYRFLLDDGAKKVEVKAWANDVDKRPDLKKLVSLIKALLEKYTKKDVVI
ncbi:MAG: hypothetical protein GYA24_14190 [Candidatus Lokiarchaeota archaeon]|nr:hypothetical protein [Candidatus Lokiarchaeota archaeon]